MRFLLFILTSVTSVLAGPWIQVPPLGYAESVELPPKSLGHNKRALTNVTTTETTAWGATCTDLHIPISVERTTPYTLTLENYNVSILYEAAKRHVLVSNTYEIAGRLCIPAPRHRKRNLEDTIHVLVHGATFNKIMWDFPYKPEKYSYTKRANEEGYTTFAFDLVGAGNSTFPNGLMEANTGTFVEVTHQVIKKLRTTTTIGNKTWKRIIFGGFSIGGIVANSLAEKYPADVDLLLLHGISWDITWIYPAFLAGLQASASTIDPQRWGGLEPFYQTQTTRASRLAACFYGNYEAEITEWDWRLRDFDSLGAALTFTFHLVTAPKFKGPVFLGIGENDSTFCGGEKCSTAPYDIVKRFPEAKVHNVRVYKDTGHLVLLHKTGPQLIEDSLRFLKENGF
ncbi:Alpha/Beta hydrolase protein [Pyronema omphalodes]|nr:Alpha/Beta hydrolase protein [Pyronema omphalodes]